jgi:hypothetical protein
MRIYPYGVLNGDVKLRIEKVALDGNPVIPQFIDDERRIIGIKQIGSTQWGTLSFRIFVDGPSSELSATTQWTNVEAVVSANCGPSNTRVAIPLQPKPGSIGRWTGLAELDRVDWFGSIAVSGSITATVDGVKKRLIGVADSWQISLDDLPRPPAGQAMTIKWEKFVEPADPSHNYLIPYADEPFFVRIDSTNPILFLNSGFQGLYGLLSDRKRRPASEGALHDQLRGAIAAETWFQLFIDALNHIQEVEGEVDWPEAEWRTNALQLLLEQIYGSSDLESLRRAHEAWKEPAGAAALIEQALPASFAQGRMTRLLRRAIQTIPSRADDIEADGGEVTQ